MKLLLILASILFQILTICKESNQQTTENYSLDKKSALNNLRKEVESFISKDYHKTDLYLINWLKKYKFDVNAARDALKYSFDYRNANNIDGVTEEVAMFEMRKKYPAYFGEAFTKDGLPAYQVPFGKWDIRRIMLAGKRNELNRYIFFIFENLQKKMRDNQVNQYIFFANMANYNLRNHACLACLTYYSDLTNIYEKHYPNSASKIIAINSPRLFEGAVKIMLPLMSKETRDSFKVFGSNKIEWQPEILEIFDAKVLTPTYGGTKKDDLIE